MHLVNVEIVFVVAGWEFDELTPAVEAAVADGRHGVNQGPCYHRWWDAMFRPIRIM